MTLVIRPEQMAALNERFHDKFVQKLAGLFATRYPDKFPAGETESIQFIRGNLPRARKYGIKSELSNSIFLDFLLLHGSDFETRPEYAWALALLTEPDGTGDERMAMLDSRLQIMNGIRKA
jgi:hypothetical protein